MKYLALTLAVLAAGGRAQQAAAIQSLQVFPAAVHLDAADDWHRLVVVAEMADGTTRDVTTEAELKLADPTVARIGDDRRLRPSHDGETVLAASYGGRRAEASVAVTHVAAHPEVSFANDVVPVLTRAGCNAGTCHGAAAGKNGFRLSLFGFDKAADFLRLTHETHGRRVNTADPDASLMLLKPTTRVAHRGGKRLQPGDANYEVLRSWIAHGSTDDLDTAPRLVSVDVQPTQAVIVGSGQRQRLVVTAHYADGSDRDVTDLALLSSSNDSTATVDGEGVVTSKERGESFVMARFGIYAVVTQVLVLPAGQTFTWPADVEARNYIDERIHDKLRKMHLAPAPVCDDATFVRRLYLDVLNILPMPDEARRFVADQRPDKRARLIDQLLQRPEFPDVWAMQWAEVLRVDSTRMESKGMFVFTDWLRRGFRDNRPFDEMVREMLTSQGGNFTVPPANYYLVERDPKALAEHTAQVFMGVRIQCAQCHNHPFERWTMDDYYGFTAFFTQVRTKRGEDPRERVVYDRSSGEIRHPVTHAIAAPKFLGAEQPKIGSDEDRRAVLAKWLTSDDNPFFANNVANRVFARFFGHGLVDPPDDVRVSNPPSHPELFHQLGAKLIEYHYDLRRLIRDLCNSRTYQLAAHPDAPPASTFAGANIRRLTAEQLLDGISQVTGVPTKYRRLPLGARATEVADGRSRNRFLDLFGRPERTSSCTCDRHNEPTLSQVLHLINGETITDKLRSDQGRLRKALKAGTSDQALLDELYLAAYGRPPTAAERTKVLASLEAADRAAAWEDVFWAVLNSREFVFQH